VQHAGETRFETRFAVAMRELFGEPRDPHAMCVPMLLIQVPADSRAERRKRQ